MKAKHLLAALALPAIFSACTQDELVTNVDKEVVGTPIGYDLEFTASLDGPTTRLVSGIGWEENDKIGMGWISDGANLAATANLYSNHPIYYKAATKVFKSETMIFEGLYIASFPYQLTQKVAPLEFDLTKQVSETSRYVGRWQVSDKFIDLRDKNAGLGSKTELTLTALTNLVQLNIKLAEGTVLPADFKVTGVTLNDGGNNKLVNKLVLKTASNESKVASGLSTLDEGCWDIATAGNLGNIDVQVGEENVGVAIDKTEGLNVYVQLGVLADDDATTLKIHTNYGDADIATGAVSYNIKDAAATKVTDFTAAIKALAAESKKLGLNIQVGVTLDATSIKANNVISNQTELANYVSALETLGQLDQAAIIKFAQSDLKAADGVVAANGDVVISDISVLNKIEGTITFQKDASAPTNVYIAGDLALAQKPTVTSVDFTILKDQTLTVSRDANLGTNNVIVNAGATLINKAAITATAVTTGATIPATNETPAVPAGLYISEAGADATAITTFTNTGEVEWRGGTLKAAMAGTLYANVVTATDMKNASDAFAVVTGNATKEIIIANDMTIPTQLTSTKLAGINKMTIKGNVTFSLGLAESFDFSDLANIDIQSGSFNLTGGNAGTGENDFYAFTAASAGCTVNLASGTELNVAAGTKLDLATSAGSVIYTSASITNNGFIAGNSASGTGTWLGNVIGVNPKEAE